MSQIRISLMDLKRTSEETRRARETIALVFRQVIRYREDILLFGHDRQEALTVCMELIETLFDAVNSFPDEFLAEHRISRDSKGRVIFWRDEQ